jgi:Domain of unknown function (DUF4337)
LLENVKGGVHHIRPPQVIKIARSLPDQKPPDAGDDRFSGDYQFSQLENALTDPTRGNAAMPEEPEVELAELREERAEEKAARGLVKAIAFTTALFAALAAVAALRAGGTVNEALLLKTEATQLQSQASDQWSEYQAKTIKAALQDIGANTWTAAGKQPPAAFRQKERYAREQQTLAQTAHQLEGARDRKSEEAEHLLHDHHRFANSVALFQVAIALAAIAALAQVRIIWFGSLLIGLSGATLFFTTIL